MGKVLNQPSGAVMGLAAAPLFFVEIVLVAGAPLPVTLRVVESGQGKNARSWVEVDKRAIPTPNPP